MSGKVGETWVFTTMEPCGMCMEVMRSWRVKGVVWSTGSTLGSSSSTPSSYNTPGLGGAKGAATVVEGDGWKYVDHGVSFVEGGTSPPIVRRSLDYEGGEEAGRAGGLVREFFRRRRREGKERGDRS